MQRRRKIASIPSIYSVPKDQSIIFMGKSKYLKCCLGIYFIYLLLVEFGNIIEVNDKRGGENEFKNNF